MVETLCLCLPVAADQPVPASLHVVDNKMSIKWQARVGVTYQVQGSNDLKNWQNHRGIRVGPTGNSAPVDRSYRHYRVMELKSSGSTKRPSRGDERISPTERGKTFSENTPASPSLPENEAPQKVKPLPKGFKSLKALAEKGDTRAQYNLGNMYADGRGVEKDAKEAARWYRKAAEQGSALAQSNLGAMYAKGEGVLEDNKEAVKWWRKGAEQGNATSQFNLGVRYAYGKGVERDAKEAVRWYRMAAEQGIADAQNNLGLMYDNGEGVLEDDVTAYAWYNIAAANGGALAKKNKGIIAKEMTPDQIAKAQELSKEMVKKNPKLLKKK